MAVLILQGFRTDLIYVILIWILLSAFCAYGILVTMKIRMTENQGIRAGGFGRKYSKDQ